MPPIQPATTSPDPAQDVGWLGRWLDPIRRLRAHVRAIPGGQLAWRLVVTLVGAVIVAVGIVLLPLPGPGWLIIFAGIGVWSTEYAWAARLLRWTRDQVTRYSARLRAWWQRRRGVDV
jgi:uncharacterized protein (TIGR02611 family)